MEAKWCNGNNSKGTITGLTLQYQLGLLNNLVTTNYMLCYPADGTYTHGLGDGSEYALFFLPRPSLSTFSDLL